MRLIVRINRRLLGGIVKESVLNHMGTSSGQETKLNYGNSDHLASRKSLFPLELVDFEHYMLADDSPEFPMTIPVNLEMSGEVDRAAFESSFNLACARHPFSSVRVEEREGRFFWIASESPKISWVDSLPDLVEIDLRNETGMKVFAKQEDLEVSIFLVIHHSVTDGGGIAQFVEDWMIAYKQTGDLEEAISMPLLKPDQLKNRGKLGMSLWRYLLRPVQEFCGAIGVAEYFSHRPVAMGPQRFDSGFSLAKKPRNRRFTFRFSASETKSLVSLSKQTKYPINDLLLAAYYSACQTWLEKNSPEDSDQHLRMMVPMNLRKETEAALPMCNFVSMIFLDRKPGRSKTVRNVCWYVWLEMSTIKIMRLGYTFIHMIRALRWLGWLPTLLRRDRSIATSLLSNMGRIYAGSKLLNSESKIESRGLTLESMAIFPPVREFLWMSALVSTYAGQMQFSCSFCEDAIRREDVESIMESLKQNLLANFDTKKAKSSKLNGGPE